MEKKTPLEVLIYVQKVKSFILQNEEMRKRFFLESNESAFFLYVSELAQKNLDEHGSPELSIEQFEEIKIKTASIENSIGRFLFLGEYGVVSLN